jgi:hypothetical protein
MVDIELAKGTNNQGLPEMLATLLRQNLEKKPHRVKDFNALDIAVGLRVTDLEIEVTLAFEKGRLVVYKGLVENPKLLIITTSDTIFDLNLVSVKCGLPWYLDGHGRKVLKSLLSGRLKIRGMWTHLVSLTRLTKIMSVR